jgi:hypothetical protein
MPPPTQVELIEDATRGFDLLLNNDLEGGKAVFLSNPGSPAHGVGLGITAFLQAALGQEDAELFGALDVLVKAEGISSAQAGAKRGKHEPATVYPAGTEYKVGEVLETRCGRRKRWC